MKELSKIAKSFEQSVFTTISQLSSSTGSINLSQGMPDFDGPLIPREAAVHAIMSQMNQQSPAHGLLELRQIISNNYQSFYQLDYSPENEITITVGATEGLMSTFLSLLNPLDEVIVFEPFFDTYIPAIKLCGAVPVIQTLHAPTFEIDFNELEKAITKRTKAIVINTPHNPTGKILTQEARHNLANIILKHDLYLISDEVYQFLTYDQLLHTPLAKEEALKDRTFTISSTGKTLGLTGWRVGWVAAPAPLTHLVRMVHQNVTFAAARPLQYGAYHGLSSLSASLASFKQIYQAKRDILFDGLKQAGFSPLLPESSYFIMTPVPTEESDMDFVLRMVHQSKVAAIPCSAFYQKSSEGKRWLRFCFAKEDQTLQEAIVRLKDKLKL